jgi:ribose 5-phosphate isomerase B
MRVAVAFDHRGVKLRARVLQAVQGLGHELVDLGTDTDTPRIDYPDKAKEVGQAIRSGDAERAVFVCGSGVGASIAASKLAGIRAGLCHDTYSARQGVQHDDMNVLCIGSGVVGEDLTDELIAAFLAAEFDGAQRYRRRLEKIEAIEREGLNV